jgi:gamma-glutamylcyclotransferase (GGCT)/AIG2-like uncharacterized protein YtfP
MARSLTGQRLFAYGTLRCADIMAEVTGMQPSGVSAVLSGYTCYQVRNESYPAIAATPNGVVQGLLYEDIPTEVWTRLDRFEGNMYERRTVIVTMRGESIPAQTYVIGDSYRDLLEPVEWNYDCFLRKGKQAFMQNYPGYRELR